MSRSYTKKNLAYWNSRTTPAQTPQIAEAKPMADLEYSFDDKPHYSEASCDNGYSRSYRDIGTSPAITDIEKYKNIKSLDIPFYLENGNYSVSQALDSIYRSYYGIQVIRNYINMMVDFSKSPLHVRCENKTVENFFKVWLNRIDIDKLMAEYFMEYYRSGNVFIYKFNGKIKERNFETLKASFGAKSDTLPIRYIVLNPMQVQLQYGPGFRNNWIKVLSKFELARLKDPQTPEDKQIFDSLPEANQKIIKSGGQFNYIYIPLDTSRLYYVFYKKQNYEPFAVPPLYGLLNDIEHKLELKRMDMALARTIEQVILLVTTGDKPDQFSKGTNPKNLERLQSIFKNQTIGRVLVADYSTKAQWVIPDLKELLGGAKYERVNQDIKDGLQYMFFGGDKFANASIKLKMFIGALKEGRDLFLREFLMPEVTKIVESMGFKNMPEFRFEDVDLQDEALMNKVYIQMAQMGLLDPDELNKAIETGILPTKEESLENQKEYIKNRKKGLYTPLLGGNDMSQKDNGTKSGSDQFNGQQGGRPTGSGTPISNKKISPIGTKASEDDRGQKFSVSKIIDYLKSTDLLKEEVSKAARKKWKIKKLNETQDIAVESIAKSIVLNEEPAKWQEVVAEYLIKPKDISKETSEALDNISIEYDVDNWVSMILFKSEIK